MKFSVIIPVYNAAENLRHSLDSVVAQTHSDWECICVDDGSTDDSGRILDEYAAKDGRFRVIHKPNGGVSSARNTGLDTATGELAAFLDSDDTWHPQTLSILEKTHLETGADVIRFAAEFVSSHDKPFTDFAPDICGKVVDFRKRAQSAIRLCSAGAATAISRNALGEIRFSPLSQGEDVIFILDCIIRTGKISFIDAPLLHYLVHPMQSSRKISESLILGTCNYIPEFANRLSKIGESKAAATDSFYYLCDILFLRLFKSWQLFNSPTSVNTIKEAFWQTLARLAKENNFFPPMILKFILAALKNKSPFILKVAVIWPYRLGRKFRRKTRLG